MHRSNCSQKQQCTLRKTNNPLQNLNQIVNLLFCTAKLDLTAEIPKVTLDYFLEKKQTSFGDTDIFSKERRAIVNEGNFGNWAD